MTGEMIERVSLGAALEDLVGAQDGFPLVVRFALGSGRAGGRVPETLLALADALDQAAELGMALSDAALVSSTDAAWVPDRAPVVRLVDKLLWDAAQQQAGEVRIRAAEGTHAVALEFRVGGEWRAVTDLPIDLLGPICRRLCVMAGINWALKQPALGTLRVGDRETDVRGTVQFMPGESERDHEVRVTLAEGG
jgi:type II secretory ATPase GspE/PulE/Tfp pilus assembly ATPase PilB-like protein